MGFVFCSQSVAKSAMACRSSLLVFLPSVSFRPPMIRTLFICSHPGHDLSQRSCFEKEFLREFLPIKPEPPLHAHVMPCFHRRRLAPWIVLSPTTAHEWSNLRWLISRWTSLASPLLLKWTPSGWRRWRWARGCQSHWIWHTPAESSSSVMNCCNSGRLQS